MIKAVLFDVDGVLVDSVEVNYRFCSDLFKLAGLNFVSKKDHFEKYYSMPLKEIIDNVVTGPEEKKEEIYNLRWKLPYKNRPQDILEGEKLIISQLAKKYKLAIVTGRIKRGVEAYFQASGLEKYFSAVVCRDDYTKPKPDPEPLLMALTKLKEESNNAVFVGDGLSDLQAAQALKMKFIGFYAVSGKKFSEAEANIGTFADLAKTIDKLDNK